MKFPQKIAMIAVIFAAGTFFAVTVAVAITDTVRADVLGRILLTTYLRDGPGVRYRTVDEAQTGTQVSVIGCANAWCNVAYAGVSGYVSQSMLAPPAGKPAPLKNPACFTAQEAGYHGGRAVQFCHSQSAPP